jgi:hypothetical protein
MMVTATNKRKSAPRSTLSASFWAKRNKVEYNKFKNGTICRAVQMLLNDRKITNGPVRGDIARVVKKVNQPSIVNADSIYYRLKRYNAGIPLNYCDLPKLIVCDGSVDSSISSFPIDDIAIGEPATISTKDSAKELKKIQSNFNAALRKVEQEIAKRQYQKVPHKAIKKIRSVLETDINPQEKASKASTTMDHTKKNVLLFYQYSSGQVTIQFKKGASMRLVFNELIQRLANDEGRKIHMQELKKAAHEQELKKAAQAENAEKFKLLQEMLNVTSGELNSKNHHLLEDDWLQKVLDYHQSAKVTKDNQLQQNMNTDESKLQEPLNTFNTNPNKMTSHHSNTLITTANAMSHDSPPANNKKDLEAQLKDGNVALPLESYTRELANDVNVENIAPNRINERDSYENNNNEGELVADNVTM